MKNKRFKLAILTLFVAFSLPAQADWAPKLEAAAQGEFREPMETFRILLPADLPLEVLQTLALELDAIDVTAMVSRDGDYAVFTPVQPLEWGVHTLRLVEYASDGSINERGYWEFQVRRSSVFREIDYAADINLTASQRVADKFDLPPGEEEPDGFTGQGSAAFQGRVADDDWEATGQMDLIYNSEKELTTNRNSLDMGEYLITARVPDQQLTGNLGHHSLAQNSLIMEGFHRRGVSGGVGIHSLNSSVTGFAMRAEQISGFQNGLGVGDANNRVDGLVWETQPFSEDPQQLYLAATYLSGQSNAAGEAVGATDADQSGDAWSLVADSSLFEQQLRLRGEIAGTTIDRVTIDPGDTDLLNETADAYSLSATYTPQQSGDSGLFWNVGVESSEIGTFFISLANPNLPADKKLDRVFVNADWNGLSAQLASAKETDNVDNLDDRPRVETRLNQLALNYSLTETPPPNTLFDTLGVPSLTLQYTDTDQQQVENVYDSFNNPLYADFHLVGDMMALLNSYSHQTWSWNWGVSRAEQESKLDPTQRQVTYSRDLGANVQINQRIVVQPTYQSQTTQTAFDSGTSDTEILGLSSQFLFTDTINGQIYLNQSKTESNLVGSSDSTTDTLTMQFTWNWILPKNKKPGFDVMLTGSYQDIDYDNPATTDSKTYQVFLSLVLKLPLSSAE